MAERTEIEKHTRSLIALDIMYKPFSSLGDKGKRRAEKEVASIYELLKEGEEKGERIFARIEEKEEEKARTFNEGIGEFEKQYPTHAKILRGMIAEKRLKRNKYLVYGLQPTYKLGEEDYLRVMIDLGFNRRGASSVYPHILEYSERLGKAIETAERSMLIK